VEFPQYWQGMCEMLDNLRKENMINHSFRLLIDLQGYSQSAIPDSFLFNHSFSFHLNKVNCDELANFKDIWNDILDTAVLDALTAPPKVSEDTSRSSSVAQLRSE